MNLKFALLFNPASLVKTCACRFTMYTIDLLYIKRAKFYFFLQQIVTTCTPE